MKHTVQIVACKHTGCLWAGNQGTITDIIPALKKKEPSSLILRKLAWIFHKILNLKVKVNFTA